MLIGEGIKRLREKCNLTQYALSKKVDTTQHCISQIEKGTKEPSRKLFAAIINTLTSDNSLGCSDFHSIIEMVLQFFIPGCRCSQSTSSSSICIELPSGFKTDLDIKIKSNQINDSIIHAIITAILEDDSLKNVVQSLLRNDILKLCILEAESNNHFRKVLQKLYSFRDNNNCLSFFDATLDNIKKSNFLSSI